MENALKTFADSQTQYLKIEGGQKVTGIYRGYKIVQSTFDPSKQKVQYGIEVGEVVKVFESGAGSIALFFADCAKGATIEIACELENGKKRYKIVKLEQIPLASEFK